MKLKTLKDLEIVDAYEFNGKDEVLKEIKKEAIKWVKELRKPLHMEDKYDVPEVIDWIKNFFNITEEDLK